MVTASFLGCAVVRVPRVMGLDSPVTPLPPLTSFTGLRSRTLISFLIRRQTDWIKLIFWGFLSTLNCFVATFALGWPTDPGSRKHLIALPAFEIARVLVRLDHGTGFRALCCSVFARPQARKNSHALPSDRCPITLSRSTRRGSSTNAGPKREAVRRFLENLSALCGLARKLVP